MSHLTTKDILQYVDGTVLDGERTVIVAHLEECELCRKEVELQRLVARTAHHAPLGAVSKQFTARVMERVLPAGHGRWLQKIMNNLGAFFAMLLVLGIVGYALTTPMPGASAEQPGALTSLLKSYGDLYHQAERFLAVEVEKLQKASGVSSSPDRWRIIAFTLVSVVVLVVLDRLVARRVVRTRV